MEGLTSAGAPDPILTDGAGHGLFTVFSSALPTGAATSAVQGTANTSLASILAALGSPAQAGGKIDTVIASASTDRGASITSATAVQLAASNPTRRGWSVQNQSASACYVSTVTTATTATADYHSLQVPTGSLCESSPQHAGTGAISVICPSASSSSPASIYAREY